MAAVALPGGQQLACLFRRFRLDAPFLGAGAGLCLSAGAGLCLSAAVAITLFLGESLRRYILAARASENKSTTQP